VFQVIGYEPNAQCQGCDKDRECIVIKTEAFTGPHCARCAMREAKKRHAPAPKPTIPLATQANAIAK